MSKFSTRLQRCRANMNMTQKAAAAALNLSERAYQHYELSTREPDIEILIDMAELFCVSLDYLVARSTPKSFKAWAIRHRFVDSPIGDFCYDINRARDYPEKETYSELLSYFKYHASRMNNPKVLELFKSLWAFHKNLLIDEVEED